MPSGRRVSQWPWQLDQQNKAKHPDSATHQLTHSLPHPAHLFVVPQPQGLTLWLPALCLVVRRDLSWLQIIKFWPQAAALELNTELPASPSEKQSKTPVTLIHSLLWDYFMSGIYIRWSFWVNRNETKLGVNSWRGPIIFAGMVQARTQHDALAPTWGMNRKGTKTQSVPSRGCSGCRVGTDAELVDASIIYQKLIKENG